MKNPLAMVFNPNAIKAALKPALGGAAGGLAYRAALKYAPASWTDTNWKRALVAAGIGAVGVSVLSKTGRWAPAASGLAGVMGDVLANEALAMAGVSLNGLAGVADYSNDPASAMMGFGEQEVLDRRNETELGSSTDVEDSAMAGLASFVGA